jgi:hypothetical protein
MDEEQFEPLMNVYPMVQIEGIHSTVTSDHSRAIQAFSGMTIGHRACPVLTTRWLFTWIRPAMLGKLHAGKNDGFPHVAMTSKVLF